VPDWPEVSVLIPAHNEAGTVGTVIERAAGILGVSAEIIVVDDGSDDRTGDIVDARRAGAVPIRLVRRARTGGKGAAVRDGLPHCTGRFIVLQDADLELDPAAYPELLAPLRAGRADMVNGSRFLHGRGAAPRRTAIANRVLTAAGNAVYGTRLSDICSGHKAFRRDLLLALPLRSRGYELESELVGLAARHGAVIVEVPTSYLPRTKDEGKRIGARDGLRVLQAMLVTRFRRV
jgi:glycosyltransferase involved in cell wall biosynthesis